MPINQHGLSPPGAVFYGVGIRDLNLTVDWGNRFLVFHVADFADEFKALRC